MQNISLLLMVTTGPWDIINSKMSVYPCIEKELKSVIEKKNGLRRLMKASYALFIDMMGIVENEIKIHAKTPICVSDKYRIH